MSEKRRTQNREAQRKFREKRAKLDQQLKEQLQRLSSQCEELQAENEALKRQQLAKHDCSIQVVEESAKDPVDPARTEWAFDSLPPSQVAGLSDGTDDELFLFSMQEASPSNDTPGVDKLIGDAALPRVQAATPSLDELRDIALPTIERPPSGELELVVETQALPCPKTDSYDAVTYDSLAFPDPLHGLDRTLYDTTPFPPGMSNFSTGPPDMTSLSLPKMDMFQAMLQLAFANERIALIDLERAKLHACGC